MALIAAFAEGEEKLPFKPLLMRPEEPREDDELCDDIDRDELDDADVDEVAEAETLAVGPEAELPNRELPADSVGL